MLGQWRSPVLGHDVCGSDAALRDAIHDDLPGVLPQAAAYVLQAEAPSTEILHIHSHWPSSEIWQIQSISNHCSMRQRLSGLQKPWRVVPVGVCLDLLAGLPLPVHRRGAC